MNQTETDGALIEPIVVSPKEAMRLMNCGHNFLYKLIHEGAIDARSDGRRTKITLASIRRRLASLPPAKVGKRK
jgi:excisionase family DNA binding protein